MNERKEVVNFRLPDGDVITVKLISRESLDTDGGVIFEPVSDNADRVHHHSFEDRDGNCNILIRDQKNQNIAAYVLNKSNGDWIQRRLTSAEERER
jgi:hypothetical protein